MSELDEIKARLSALEDARAIEQLKYEYAGYCDNQYDPDGIAGLFVEDGEWIVDGEGATLSGRDAIRTHFAALSSKITWALHFMIAPKIDVAPDGQTASGTFYLLCLCTIEKSDTPGEFDAVILTLNYRDKFVKRDGRWYFQELIGKTHQVSNWDQGWVKQQFRP
jgi:ketosteroid isomerase-like protein